MFRNYAYICVTKQSKSNQNQTTIMANIHTVLEILKAGKAICTNLDVRMDNKCANVLSATWQMVGFNKAGELVGYNYQLKAEDFKSAYDACFLQVRMKTSEPSKFIAKAQWAFGKTPAECVAQALNEQKIDGCCKKRNNRLYERRESA